MSRFDFLRRAELFREREEYQVSKVGWKWKRSVPITGYCDLDKKKSGNGVLDVCLRFSCHQRQFQIYSDSYKKTRNGEFKCREKVDNPGLL